MSRTAIRSTGMHSIFAAPSHGGDGILRWVHGVSQTALKTIHAPIGDAITINSFNQGTFACTGRSK